MIGLQYWIFFLGINLLMADRYNPTDRIGVNAVEMAFLKFGWIFREQAIADMGVDAHVEVCDDGKPLGRLIALQIKSGKSYFKEATARGWVYRGASTHLNYWLNHSLPVVLVLHDPTVQKTWWETVSDKTVESTGSDWKLTVPFAQELNATAQSYLHPIALLDFNNRRELERLAGRFKNGVPMNDKGTSSMPALLASLRSAKNSIDVASQRLSPMLFEALKEISSTLVVRVIVSDPDEQKGNGLQESSSKELISANYQSSSPNLHVKYFSSLHQKLVLIDRSLLISGSMNLTDFGLRIPYEQMVVVMSGNRVDAAVNDFESVWQQSRSVESC